MPSAITFSSFTLNATTDLVEFIFQTDEAVTITSLGFRYGARTGTPPTYRVSLQGVDASGNPNGTIKGATNNCFATFTPPADTSIDGLWQWKTTVETYAAARGEWLAIVIDYSSGTVDGTNNSSFGITCAMDAGRHGVPYATTNDAGVRTRQTTHPIFGYQTASQTYGPVLQSNAATVYSSGSTPDEQALEFTLPAAWGSTFQVVGIYAHSTVPIAARTVLVQLYDGTTVLQGLTWDTDYIALTGNRLLTIIFGEATLSTLTYGNTYRVGFAPQEVDTAFGLRVGTNAAATDWQGWSGGQSFALATRTDAGAWTTDALSRPWIDLILKDITEPVSGPVARNIMIPSGAR